MMGRLSFQTQFKNEFYGPENSVENTEGINTQKNVTKEHIFIYVSSIVQIVLACRRNEDTRLGLSCLFILFI